MRLETSVMVVAINSENDKRWEGSQGIYSLIGLILHWNFDQQLTCVGGRDWSAQLVATIHDQTKFESASLIYNSKLELDSTLSQSRIEFWNWILIFYFNQSVWL